MAEPKQKSRDHPTFLTRILPTWQTPAWMEAERWRQAVANQPVAMICRTALIDDSLAARWQIQARDEKETDMLTEDIDIYTDVLNTAWADPLGLTRGFDPWLDVGYQDLTTLPIGWNNEVLRWQDGEGPLTRPHPKGHVFLDPSGSIPSIVFMDGANIWPTFDKQFPIAQRLKGELARSVFFTRNEVARAVMSPRPEIQRQGFGMAPPEKIFLAISLLFRGDTYYANLLLDTPEAGILDLADFKKKDVEDWIGSFRELFTGIDPMKIGVLYEHDKSASYINFGRPPSEMLLDTTTLKYMQLAHAGYGLTLTDTGLGDPQKTMAGSIRDDRRSQRSGFSTVKSLTKGMIDTEILPPYLEFIWIKEDIEGLVQRGRAFLLAAQGLAKAKEAGFLTKQEGQAQLVKDGHITVEVEEPEEIEPPPMLSSGPPQQNGNQDELDRVPAEQGGRGDMTGQANLISQSQADTIMKNAFMRLDALWHGAADKVLHKAVPQEKGDLPGKFDGISHLLNTARADLGDETISAVPTGSAKFDQMAGIVKEQFAGVMNRMTESQLMRLIKAATRSMFPDVAQAFIELSDAELPIWTAERLGMWFGEKSEFDDLPDVLKRIEDDVLKELNDLLDGNDWWKFDPKAESSIGLVLRLAFEEGATRAAEISQELLFTEGLTESPTVIGLNFNLTNPRTLAELEAKAAQLVTRVDDGTRFFLRRIITAGVDEGLASPSIAQLIREGADAEAILKEAGYTSRVVDTVRSEVGNMTQARTDSIVNTEIARAETDGRVGQWQQQGLTRKRWLHTGVDSPCPFCTRNIELDFVPMDFLYESVFGGADTLGPPAHPTVDHCHIAFDEAELIDKAGVLEVWMGE